ncbi:MAG: tRNA uridine-5-carboxymethylaminomethyl(34) synthesis GTPase MnmE [Ruminococcus sp.]|nr:tRNA uridine-5-carboxymethylaminomethyl(34) synthesis GTPase MnmE [Ruminococcus sp.]
MRESTIAAISTAQGAGGIGIIRISGDRAIEIADKVFVAFSGTKLCEMQGYRAAYGKILFEGETLDECVALVFRAPKSFTGENVVELCCHGGTLVTKLVLRAVLSSGAEPAEAGEFTRRAFLNGKMNLSEAESIMNLISAQSKSALKAATEVRQGSVSKKIYALCDKLENTAAHLSAWADFPEEDIPEVSDEVLNETLDFCYKELEALIKNYDAGKAITQGVPTAILGKPNVGKSTLMNLLSGFDKSIVTDIPGTTRDVVEETVVLGEIILRLSDTAGIHKTDNIVEQIGVDRAKEKIDQSQLLLIVFDSSTPLDEEDKLIISEIGDTPAVAVINKSDLDSKIDLTYIENKFKHVVFISAKQGTGKDELISAVTKATGTTDFSASAVLLAGERQRSAAENALLSVKSAIEAMKAGFSLDAVTIDLENALQKLYELVGKNVSEEIVDKVFHNFCVGK